MKRKEVFRLVLLMIKGESNVQTHTYYVWNEPPELTQHGLHHLRISEWNNILDKLPSKIAGFRTEAPSAYDLRKGGSVLFYPRHEVDAEPSQTLAFILYGLVGFGYMYYEEIIARLTKTEISDPVIDDKKYIKRRTFLKLIASLGGYLGIRNVQDVFARDNEDLPGGIKEHTQSILTQKDIDPVENFKRYFRVTPMQIRQTLADINNVSRAVLESGYNGRQVWGER